MGGAQFVASQPRPPRNEHEALAMLAAYAVAYAVALLIIAALWVRDRRHPR